MLTETPASAEAPADSDLTSALDRAEEAITARNDGGEEEKPSPPAAKEQPAKAEPEKRKPQQAGGIAALAQREWKVQQRERALEEREGKLKPIEEALSKKDVRGAVKALFEKHGYNFTHVVEALSEDDKAAEKTPAEIAREAAQEELRKAREDDQKKRDEERQREIDARLVAMHARLADMAEKGTAEDPNRWEETAVAGKAAEAWDLIEKWYEAKGEKLELDDALDRIEKKLREKREARRPKTDAGKSIAGGKARNEAATKKPGGRVAVPSFTNRKTSGVPAAVASDDDDSDGDDSDNAVIDRFVRKRGIA